MCMVEFWWGSGFSPSSSSKDLHCTALVLELGPYWGAFNLKVATVRRERQSGAAVDREAALGSNTLTTPYYEEIRTVDNRGIFIPYFMPLFWHPFAQQDFMYSLKNTQKGHFIIWGEKSRGSSTFCVHVSTPEPVSSSTFFGWFKPVTSMAFITDERCEQGSNLRGETPLDFESNALTSRPSQLAFRYYSHQDNGMLNRISISLTCKLAASSHVAE